MLSPQRSSPGSPGAGRPPATAARAVRRPRAPPAPGFADRILSICLETGFSPEVVQNASEMQTILSMVASGLGVAILPRSAGGLGVTEVAMRPLAGEWPPSELGMATLRVAADDPLLTTFGAVVGRLPFG